MAPTTTTDSPLDANNLETDKYVDDVVSQIRSGKLHGSYNIAVATVGLLDRIIQDSENATAMSLFARVRAAGRRLTRALPHELPAANMVRRVLRAIRDEQRAQQGGEGGEGAGSSLQRLVRAGAARRHTLGAPADLREPLRDHIAELQLELESTAASICTPARGHVHADELILSLGAGALLERFLRAAAARRYRLLLAEGAQARQSHAMAARLSGAGVSVTVISNAAVCGVMSRVNKVIVCVRGVLAGGAVLGDAGLLAVTSAARFYSVPVLALAPLYALTPQHAAARHRLAAPAAPHHALPYGSSESGSAQVFAPLHDVVPPDHLTLFVTNLGGSSPTYIYRLLSELYDPEDYEI